MFSLVWSFELMKLLWMYLHEVQRMVAHLKSLMDSYELTWICMDLHGYTEFDRNKNKV